MSFVENLVFGGFFLLYFWVFYIFKKKYDAVNRAVKLSAKRRINIERMFKEYGISKLRPIDFCFSANPGEKSKGCNYNWKLNFSSDIYIIYSFKHESGIHFVLSINKVSGVVKIIKTHIEEFTLFAKLERGSFFIVYQDVVENIRDVEIVLENNVDQDIFFKREDVEKQRN